ncbi:MULTISPECIES: hemagglutinin repeat-containing protein [unclassified Rhizobium]|uniref:hemagglutinin repeat-containing protein n=1 Tax=unclassified Rhizobium TaxID=2613769 RepID=UPI001FE22B75|nr:MULTISPECIES: hemagglutinin repeat-containing protein [unclassified Rhizobium]
MSGKIMLVGSKLATVGREAGGGPLARLVRFAHHSLAATLSVLLFLQPAIANAQSVSAAGSAPTTNQPGVGAAPNGVPLVDIVTPNGTGLSHNKYDNFNVGTPGLILNNFNGEVGTSNLGGATPGNPNLRTSGPASVILNEVTSGNRSALNGPTEVFGGRADVVIANPNGITCNGCGFINTPRATLTTGVPDIGSDGRLTGFTVNGGDVTFEGAGGNFAAAPGAVDLFDVVSRNIHVNAPVYGKTIRLTGGASKYDYATGEATALTATSGTPEYAIDGTALGAMQADRIKVVVTEKGAGVKMSGDMAANAGELSLSADGKISIGNASARDGVTITSKRQVTAAKVTSKQKVTVQADQGVTLQSVAADSDIALSSGTGLLSVAGDVNSGATVQMSSGGIAAGSVIAGNGAATLVATAGDIAIAGAANSTGDLNLTATTGSISAASLLSNQTIALNAGLDIAVAGNVLAQGNVSATGRSVSIGMVVSGINIAATSANPSGNIVLGSTGNLGLTATGGNIATGNLLSAGPLNAGASGNVTANSVQSAGDLAITAASLTASGIKSHGALTVNAAANVSGQILGANNILISGSAISAGAIVSGVDFAAIAANGGNLVLGSGGDITLQSSGSLAANTLLAAGTIFATSADLAVGNVTGHQAISLSGSSNLTATGQVLGAGDVSLSGGSISVNQVVSGLDFAATEANGGNLVLGAAATIAGNRAGDLTLQASGSLSASALLAAGTITATATDLSLGSVTGHEDVALTGGNSLTATGQILGANDITLSGGAVTTGQVVTGVDFTAMAQSSTGAIVIGSAGDLTVNATSATTGPLLVAGDLSVTSGSFTASNITGHGNVTVNAASTTTASGRVDLTGTLLAAGNVDITGANITAGTVVSGVDFAATGQSADGSVVLSAQSPATVAGSTGALTLKATAGNINAANLLSAGAIGATASGSIGNSVATNAVAHKNLTMTAGGTIALAGQSMAAGNISLQGQSISAASLVSGVDFAATRASATGALMLAQGNAQSGTMTLIATNGDITASNALLSGGNLNATASGGATIAGIGYALLQSLADASLTAPGSISYTNNTNVTGNLTIDTGTIDLSGTRGAKLAVGGTLAVTAASANLSNGSLVLGGLTLNLSGQADLTGAQVNTVRNAGGSGDIAISAAGLTASDTTTLLAAHDLTLTLPTLSNSGQIAAGNNLTINTSGDLTNSATGLLYAGNDASLLVAGTLTNDQGAILAGNDLTIAGSTITQRNGATTNISGLIQAGGDMSILTTNLTNKRSTTPTWVTGQLVSSGNVVGTFVLNPDVAGKPFAYLETVDQNIFQLYPGIDPPAWQDYQPLLWSQATLADGTTYHAWTWTSANGPVLVGPIFDWIKARVPKDANGNPVLDPNNPSKYFIVDEVVRNGTDASTTYTWNPTANLSQSVYEDRFTGALSPEAVIRAGGNLTVDATNLTNSYSRIEAGGDATLRGSTLTNEGVVLNRTTMLTCNAQSACTAYNADGTTDPSRDIANGTSIVSGSQVIGGAAGTLKAAGALTLNFGTVNNTSLGSTGGGAAVSAPSTSSDPLSALSGMTAGGALFTVNSALTNVAGNGGLTAGGGLTAALGNLTQISPANVAQLAALAKPQSGGVGGTVPGQAFIFEIRAAFLDVSKFYGSAYFLNRAGYDPETNIPFLGDAYFDNQLVDTQLRQLVGDGLGNGSFIPGNSAIEQMKSLLDNGAAYAEANGLAFGQGLTPGQAANLIQSIVIYQAQTVNGVQVLAPVVYLSAADRAKAGTSAGAMIAGNTVDLNVGNLNNSGAVAAAGGLNIAASTIKSTGTFYAGGNLNLTASNGITLAAQTMTIGGQNFVNPNTGVSATGNVLLAANGSDLNLQGASVKAGGNAQLSGNNVNLAAVKVDARTAGGSADNNGQPATIAGNRAENATGARVSAGGNLNIAGANDVNIIGSSAKAGGDLNVKATNGAVNIVSTDVARRTDDGYTKTSSTDQQASQLSAGGNLAINANTGVLISGSDLTAKGDVGLTSNGDINVTTSQNQSNSTFGKNSSSELMHNGSTITAGGDLVAKSKNDINVIGSTMTADGTLGLQAGKNVTIAEATDSATLDVKSSSKKGGFLGSTKENASGHLETTTAAGSSLSGKEGTTIISGGDTTVSASKVTAGDATHTADLNVQTGGNLIVTAGKDTETEHDSAKRKGFLRSGSASYDGYNETTVGSALSASGDVNLDAGKAAAIVGSKVNADGSLNVSGESVSIIGAQENHQSDSQRKDSGLFVGSGGGFISLYGKNEKQGQQSSTNNVGSTLSAGQDVNLTARATDLNIMGSSVTADRDINLSATRDVNVTPGAESLSQSEQQKKSGFGLAFSAGGGGFSIGIGAQSTKDSKAQQSDTNAMSTLSAGRDLNISAGHDVNLQATSASAERDVSLFAKNDINLLSANDVTNYQEAHEKSFAGVTLTVSSQVGAAATSIMNSAERLSDSGAVNAVTNTAIAGLGFYKAYKDLQSVYDQYQKSGDIGVNVSLTVGASHQENSWSSSSSTPVVTDIRAGRSISMEAENGSITSDGAQILAGYDKNGIPTVSGDPLTGDIFLSAKNGDINLNAATGMSDSTSANSSWSVGVGVGATFGGGGKGMADLGLVANAGYGKGSADTSGVSHTNTHVNGTGDITIITNDLALRGATITGNSVTADVKNLTIESQVDTAKAKADQLNLSAQTGFGSTSVSGVTQKAKGDAAIVTEQSGIHAGTAGLDISVSGQTSLVGGLITSQATADKNSFSTGTLTVADIDTHSTWKAETYGGTIGTSGIMPTPPVKDSENRTGQALSAIGGNIPITITDPAHQTQDIGTIRRDTDNTNTSLPGLPDLEHILRDQYKTQADLQAAQATMAGLVGDIADGLRDRATTQAEQDFWAEGGGGRALLHAIGGGILGGVNGWEGAIKGALAGAATTLMAPAIASLVKGMLKDSTLSDQDKQRLANMIGTSLGSAVGGVVGGGEGASYGAANYQYNYLTHIQLEEAKKLASALAKCEGIIANCASYDALKQDLEAYRKLSAENTAALIRECSQGQSANCISMMADLKQFNEAVNAELVNMQNNPRGSSPQSNPTPNQVRYYEAVDGGLRLDYLVEQQFTTVLAGDQTPEQARRNIITTVVQSNKNLGQLNAILNGIGLVGSGVVLILSDGTALPIVAGGLGAASSGSHLYGDVQQGITGVVTEPGLVQLLKANDMSPANAVAIQNLIDLGAVITGLGVGLKPTLAKSATSLTSAERSLVDSGILTLDEAAALPRIITTSNGEKITLPPGYKPLAGAGSAGNDVGGLPDGFARATDVKGNIVIVGTDGNIYASVADAQQAALGAMDGLSFRFDLAGHLVGPDGFAKNGRLSGTHNLNNATAELSGKGATYSLNPTTTPGIDELQYTYVQPSGKVVSGSKTVYDPRVFSDQSMVDLAQTAAQQAWTKFLQNPAMTAPIDNTVGGVRFRSYINFDANGNPFIGNVHPIK